MRGADADRGPGGRDRIRTVVVSAVSLAVAVVYFAFQLRAFEEGQRGLLRGAIVFTAASICALALLFPRSPAARVFIVLSVAVSFVGAADLVLHSPGSSLFGIPPSFPNDFHVQSGAAARIYQENASPYNPAINNFPLPTYWMLWASSGFGRWDAGASGLALTIFNLGAAGLSILIGLKLAGIDLAFMSRDANRTALLLFLIFSSSVWANIMMGQTPLIAAACIFSGLWLSRLRTSGGVALSGALLALGVMLKPTFAPFLGYFLAAWLRGRDHHHVRIIAACVGAFGIMVLASIILPGGVSLATYAAFTSHIGSALEYLTPANVSLVGALAAIFHALPRKLTAAVLIVVSLILVFVIEHRRRASLSWPVWLVTPLIVSPATWTTYTVLLLPAQLLLAKHLASTRHDLGSVLLILSAALVTMLHPLAGAAGLLMTWLLALQLRFPIASGRTQEDASVDPALAPGRFTSHDAPVAAS